ncbi:tetratricopeptide repeat protein [Avibacterium avium]|uniref:tetratricopeptide repeat protein n=1 Tax=Avibacterium avium TaxID=751 RepID=UPI003BF8B607
MKLKQKAILAAMFSLSITATSSFTYADNKSNNKVTAQQLEQQFQQATQAYRQGNYHSAFKLFKPLAERGNPTSQYNLGQMYLNGQGVRQDFSLAINWYKKAAEQGYADAQYNLALMYENGQGVKQDYAEAIKWYKKAADQNYAMAQTNLGTMYALGKGVTADLSLAKDLAGKGCDNGNQNGCDLYRILNEKGVK